MRRALIVLAILLPAATSLAQVTVDAPIDVLSWEAAGFLRVTPQRGDLAFLFDGRAETAVKAPATLLLEAQEDLVLTGLKVHAAAGTHALMTVTLSSMDGVELKRSVLELTPESTTSERFAEPVAARRVSCAFALQDGARLAEITLLGKVELKGVELNGLAHEVVVGSRHRFLVIGTDAHGGRIDLTGDAELRITPASIARVQEHELVAAESGAASIQVLVAGRAFGPHALAIFRPRPAPADLRVAPTLSAAEIEVAPSTPGSPAYALYRRKDGDPAPARPVQVRLLPRFHDHGLDAFTGYNYFVVGVDEHGNEITERTTEVHARTAANQNALRRVATLDVLVPIYRGRAGGAGDAQVLEALEWSRRFYYRHSHGRLNLALTPLIIDRGAPDTRGPSMFAIEDDLRARGVGDDWYDAVHVIADNLSGCWGGFVILGHTGGSFGSACAVPFPPGLLAREAVAWSFAHELMHSLALVIAQGSGNLKMWSHHFPDNYPLPDGITLDVGPHLDGLAKVLAAFDGYDAFKPPWDGYIEVVDTDRDGLADQDARLPIDEARLQTDPTEADTDHDGLSDLDELAAGLYQGSDPRNADTDGDGEVDGKDRFPLAAFSGTIRFSDAAPVAPSARQAHLLATVGAVEIHAWWDLASLSFELRLPRACEVLVHLDGSGEDGRFESRGRFAGSTASGPEARGDSYTDGSELVARVAQSSLLLRGEPVAGSHVLWREQDGATVCDLTIPRTLPPGAGDTHARTPDIIDGLTLEAGRLIGLNFWLRCAEAEKPVSLFEMHRLYDAVLVKE
ncbi:MAG: hypothetical protein U1E76_21470 [Planctomycetota bacterium]